MALSKQEQGVLDEIESELREDPSFAAGLDPGRVRRRGLGRALALAVPGLLLLVMGEMLAVTAVVPGVILGVCGFLGMLLAFAWPSLGPRMGWHPRWSRLRRSPDRSPGSKIG